MKVLLALGPIGFRDFELPPKISFGGTQRLATHKLANGQRIIDCLGRDDADITFSGIFAGPDASSRARMLDELRAGGTMVPLTWDVFFYTVVVAEFVASYENEAWIPYAIRCTVVRDEAQDLPEMAVSLAEILAADISTASNCCIAAGLDISTASTAILRPGATTYGTIGFQQAQRTLASSALTIGAGIDDASQQIGRADLIGGSADTALANLSSSVAAAQNLALLTRASGFVGRAITNLTNSGG